MKPILSKIILFGLIGALAGYFVFPYITPIYNFARQPSDEWWVRGVSTLLGVGMALMWGLSRLPKLALTLGTVGFFIGGMLSPLLSVLFVNGIWYELITWPREAFIFTNVVQIFVWASFAFLGVKLVRL